jgi:hypothetical protein
MRLVVLGKVKSAILTQRLKAWSPMVTTPFPGATMVRFAQSEKAKLPMFVTASGMLMPVKPLLDSKQWSPIEVT